MKLSKSLFAIAAAGALLSASLSAQAQNHAVAAKLDSTAIFVGSQVGLEVSLSLPQGAACDFKPMPDSIAPGVELVRALPMDTLVEGDVTRYVMRYLVTSFDTGLHYMPPIPVAVMPDSSVVSTPELTLQVINPFQEIQMSEEGVALIYDIHGAEDAPFQWRELLLYWPWLVGALLLAGLVAAVIWLRRKYAAKPKEESNLPAVPAEPCEVTALRDLERIREQKLWMRNQVKEFYTELTEALRRYVSARYGINAMESTSGQLMESMATLLRDDKESLRKLQGILEMADFAKFAKMEPLPDENDRAVVESMNFVRDTTPVATAEGDDVAAKANGTDAEKAAIDGKPEADGATSNTTN